MEFFFFLPYCALIGTFDLFDDFLLISVEPAEFLHSVLAAEDDQNEERAEALLCGAAKTLRGTRAKPDSVLYLSLMHLSKAKPNLFSSDIVIEVCIIILFSTCRFSLYDLCFLFYIF